MRRVINLTLPLYPGMPVCNVWPQDPSFRQEQVISYATHGARIDHISLHSESGTRLMTKATYHPEFPKIGETDLGEMVDQPTVVIDIPKTQLEEITARDIDEKVARDPAYRKGDALLIRTGWGDNQRYRQIGDDYATKTPHFCDEGAQRLAEVMREKQTDILAIDVAYIGNLAPYHMKPEWVDLPPWLRPHFPSPEARAYLRCYTTAKGFADWSASRSLHDAGKVIAALCNTGAITQKRVRLTFLPLYVEHAPGVTVTVVAVED